MMSFPVRFYILAALITGFCACSGKAGKEQPGTDDAGSPLTPGKMSLVLSDIHVVEAAYLLRRTGEVSLSGTPKPYYDSIFRKHHITAGQYEQSLTWYRDHPDQYKKVYEQVVRILEYRQKRFKENR